MTQEFSDFEDNGFSAIIEKISLFDYMQLMMMTQKDKTIEVNKGHYSGIIQIIKGKITYAETSSKKTGMDAIFEIMLLNNGNFRELKKQEVLESNIKDNGNILLQVAEYMDKIKYSESRADKVIEEISIEEQVHKAIIKDLNDKHFLETWGKDIEGLLHVAIVSINGKIISDASFYEEKENEIFLSPLSFTELLKDSIKVLDISKLGVFEELNLISSSHNLLMRFINSDFFLGIVMSKEYSSLGVLKLKMKKLLPKLKNL